MTDIVDRLRGAPHTLLNLGPNAERMMLEAAAEIERLRMALTAISQRMNFGTMTNEMRYAKVWADEALNEQSTTGEKDA